MSWQTMGVKMKDNEPADYEFHNWNEDKISVAMKWMKEYALRGFIVTMFHKTDGAKSKSK